MDHRRSSQHPNFPGQYPSMLQMSPYAQQSQMPQYTGDPNGHNDYTPALQPINTRQSIYSQGDQLRGSTSFSGYQLPGSIPVSPGYGTYAHGTYMPGPERQSIPHPPPSPSQSDNQEEEEYRNRVSGPAPEMHEFEGKSYGLRIVQEPVRARMCGFGDKDRRPITTPPIVQAVIYETATGKEVDYEHCDLELSHFVVQAHIYDIEGRNEKSIVKTAPGQQIISATLASGYPSTTVPQSPSRMPSRVSASDQVFTDTHGRFAAMNTQMAQTFSSSPYQHGATTVAGAMFPSAVPPPNFSQNSGSGYSAYGGYRNGAGVHSPNTGIAPTGPSQPPTPPLSKSEEAGPGYSRNLIGANTMTGQLLEDLDGKWGIFFAFTDLSVRSEDWFRLKFTLFNVGATITGLSTEQLFRKAEENNSAPNTMTSTEAGRAGNRRLDGLRAGLIAKSAPCLATVFSQAFKVYSAKKFPGVAEGTEISKKFAKQGVKISVRKESKIGDKRKRGDVADGSDEDGQDSEQE